MILFQSSSDKYTCDNPASLQLLKQEIYLRNPSSKDSHDIFYPESITCNNDVYIAATFILTKILDTPYTLYMKTSRSRLITSQVTYETTTLLYINVEPETISPIRSRFVVLDYPELKKYGGAVGDGFVYSNALVGVLVSLRDDYGNNAAMLCRSEYFGIEANVTINVASMGIYPETMTCLVYFTITTDLKRGVVEISAVAKGNGTRSPFQYADGIPEQPGTAPNLIYHFQSRAGGYYVSSIAVGAVVGVMALIGAAIEVTLLIKAQRRVK